jgi:tetratricopeptide (TPR) repeat protein
MAFVTASFWPHTAFQLVPDQERFVEVPLASWRKSPLKAILIFFREKLSGPRRHRGICAFAALFLCAIPAVPARAQHVVTAAARSQAEGLLQQAYTTYEAGDYAQAQLLIDQADKLEPNQPDAWNLRGALYLKEAKYDKAEAAFGRAVALDPKLWAAQFNLGEVSFHQKDYRRARARFETLLSQTDRFKDANRWELAAYKAFLSCLLMGDDAEARKRLAKLPPKGATPAYLYAQAALSFSRKDAATAEKTLATAQSTYPQAANDLFASSLETVGWQAPAAPVYASSMPVPGSAPYAGGGERPMQIDPRLESAVADPLPTSGGAVYTKIPVVAPSKDHELKTPESGKPAAKPEASASPSPAETAQDHTGLLLE